MTVRVEETEMEIRLAYRWLSSIAYWVSQIGSPPLTGAAAALLIGYVLATGAAWQWAGFYVVVTILLPCAYIIWLVRRGQITDFHLPLREERIRPLLFSLVTALVAWGILHRTTVPAPLKLLATVNGLQALLFFLITLRWKISLHCAAAAILSQLALTFFGVGALPLLMSVPLIAWSRVHMRRHTLAQTVAGACLGSAIVTPAVFFYL